MEIHPVYYILPLIKGKNLRVYLAVSSRLTFKLYSRLTLKMSSTNVIIVLDFELSPFSLPNIGTCQRNHESNQTGCQGYFYKSIPYFLPTTYKISEYNKQMPQSPKRIDAISSSGKIANNTTSQE